MVVAASRSWARRPSAASFARTTPMGMAAAFWLLAPAAIIINNTIENNSALKGGFHAQLTTPSPLSNNIIRNNGTEDNGGGIYFRTEPSTFRTTKSLATPRQTPAAACSS